MSDEATPDDQKRIEEHCAKLMEHFDVVRVFASRNDGSRQVTIGNTSGGGNFYAQVGQVQEWLDAQRQFVKNKAIREDENEQ